MGSGLLANIVFASSVLQHMDLRYLLISWQLRLAFKPETVVMIIIKGSSPGAESVT